MINGLSKAFGNVILFDNASVEFVKSKVSFIMAPNGFGKTTLIKMIANILKVDEGEIKKSSSPMIIYDDLSLYPNLSGIENIQLFTNFKFPKKVLIQKAKKYLSPALLKKKVRKYSLGEGKKLLYVLFEILKPEIAIMDEFSNGLDYSAMRSFKEKINAQKLNRIFILTGHQFDFYRDIIDELYVIHEGKIKKVEDWQKVGIEDVYRQFYE